MSYDYNAARAWTVARWMRWERTDVATGKIVLDEEPTEGIVFVGREDGARRIYDRYVSMGEQVELRYQRPPTFHPQEVVESTRTVHALTEEDSRGT